MNTQILKKVLLPILVFAVVGTTKVVAQGYKVGDVVKDFYYQRLDGQAADFAKTYAKDKGVILVFTCNTCPYAKAYEQRIIDLHKKYAAEGYPVLAINPNLQAGDTKEDIVKRIKANNIPYEYVLDDKDKPVYKVFNVKKTPEIFLLQRKGDAYTLVYTGAIDDNHEEPAAVTKKYVENAMAELLSNKRVTVTTTKAIGCTVKR